MVLDRPWEFQEAEAPRFQDVRHMKVVRLSNLHTGCLYTSHEIFLVLISVRGLSRPQGHSAARRYQCVNMIYYPFPICQNASNIINTGPMTEALCHVTNWLPCYYHLMRVTHFFQQFMCHNNRKQGLYILQYRSHSHGFCTAQSVYDKSKGWNK
jgi:hypothetical protein